MAALDPLRTDKVSGTITGGFGVTMMGFAAFSLLIVGLQRLMITAMGPIPVSPNGMDFEATMIALHQVWFLYMPLMFAGGLVFAISGWRIYRGSLVGRRVAQFNAVLGYAWGVAYALACASMADRFGHQSFPFALSPQLLEGYRWFVITSGIAMTAVFPTALLCILPRPNSHRLREQTTTNC